MIWNIIDKRKRPYRFACVNVVLEPTYHDNGVEDADLAPEERDFIVEEKDGSSLAEAIAWANGFDCPEHAFHL